MAKCYFKSYIKCAYDMTVYKCQHGERFIVTGMEVINVKNKRRWIMLSKRNARFNCEAKRWGWDKEPLNTNLEKKPLTHAILKIV